MNDAALDTTTTFRLTRADYDALPPSRKLEVAEVKAVKKHDWPTETVKRERYLPDDALTEAVNLAIALGRPLLLQGEPGCGKTRLAYALRYALELPLEECYIKSTTRAQDLLYTYDAVSRLYDAQLGEHCPFDASGRPRCRDARHYIRLGPLGRAILRARYGRRSVVLIDEIDKADLDFPNDLLRELDRYEFHIPETDQHYKLDLEREAAPHLRPIVIVTHNEEKPLPTAFLRRCIFHTLRLPTDKPLLREILALHQIRDTALSDRAIDVLLRLRQLDLAKPPGLGELIDWVGYAEYQGLSPEDLERLRYAGVLLKQEPDKHKARESG